MHITLVPYPSSNGPAKRAVQILKLELEKLREDKKSLPIAILE